nr:MAG TPA: Bradykinin [Caudoviricetes sp.]
MVRRCPIGFSPFNGIYPEQLYLFWPMNTYNVI